MSISKLPNGRWRAQVWDGRKAKNVSVGDILGTPRSSYASRREAKQAREQARAILGQVSTERVTINQWRERWITDPLFRRPKQSTNLHNEERTRAFAKEYGHLPVSILATDRGDQIVSQWLAGGRRNSQVTALSAMVNDAMSVKGGRLLSRNPFAGLKISKTKGNREIDPPDEATVWTLIRAARELCPPSFACWLQVACFTGMRPGELDALEWDDVDLERGRITVDRQFSKVSHLFTTPKSGKGREVPITPPAREALLAVPNEQTRYVFVNTRREHWTAGARDKHWNRVRKHTGFTGSLYLATRHFAGWFMTNELLLPAEDVAIVLGHGDGGYLVRTLYGHRSREGALQRAQNAYEARGNVRPIGIVRDRNGA